MWREASPDRSSILRIGSIDVRFYLREPSPDNWNAIGVVERHDGDKHEITGHRLIVGVGSSEDKAIGDLIARVLCLEPGGPSLPPARSSDTVRAR